MATKENITYRACRTCKESKLLSDFPVIRGRQFYRCKACDYKRTTQWAANNRERSRAIKDKWIAEHPDEHNAAKRKYANANPEKRAAYKRRRREHCNALERKRYAETPELWKIRQQRYRENNPERSAALTRASATRRQDRVKASPTHFTADDVLRLYSTQRARCAAPWCKVSIKKSYHVDHIIPVSRGGTNGADNIQLLCPACNLRKNAKDPYVWAQMNGRLF